MMTDENKKSKMSNSNEETQINDDIVKNNIRHKKKRKISLNNIPKNKSSSTNILYDSFADDSKSKSSCVETNKKKKEKNELNKKKKRNKGNKGKITKFLKKEKLKIPIGKRMSITQNTNLNLNINTNSTKNLNIVKSFTPRKDENIRTDKNGIEINKYNKKKVHITFIDEISPNQITEIVNIESFKKFNIVEKSQNNQMISDYNKCCNIF